MTNTTPTVASVEAGAAVSVDQHLHRFYVELQAWIDGECDKHPIFRIEQGICGNAHAWQQVNAPHYRSEWKLWDALGKQFKRAGLGDAFPFQKTERHPHRYANPARLAWIKARSLSQPVGSEAK